MATMTHVIPTLDRKGLRDFGLVTGTIVVVLFGLGFPWLLDRSLPIWPWVIGVGLAAWALIAPASLGPLYRWWMRLGMVLSKITTPIIVGTVYFLMIVPIGCAMRLGRWDAMQRRFDPTLPTYRKISERPQREGLEKPF